MARQREGMENRRLQDNLLSSQIQGTTWSIRISTTLPDPTSTGVPHLEVTACAIAPPEQEMRAHQDPIEIRYFHGGQHRTGVVQGDCQR